MLTAAPASMSRTAHCMVDGGAGSGDDAGRDAEEAGDFGRDADDFGRDAEDAEDADDFARDADDDAGDDDRPERDEPDDGLLLVGSFSVNDLNMGCPIVTR